MGESNRRATRPRYVVTRRLGVVAALAFTPTTPAWASPLEDPSLSGTSVFTGPSQPHPTAISINPAAMALMSRGQHFALIATGRLSQLFVERDVVRADGTVVAGDNVSSATVTPGALAAFDFAIGERYRIGVSLHTPQAERYPRGEDAFRYHTLGGHSYQFAGTLSTSFAAHPRFLFGFGVSLGYSVAGQDFARDTALEAGTAGVESDCGGQPCDIENPLATQRYQVRTRTPSVGELFSAKNVGLVGGAMVRITENWWIAASAILPPGSVIGTLDLSGNVRVTQAPRDGDRTLHGNAEIIFDNPVSFYLGARGPITQQLELTTHMRYQNTSVHARDDVRLFGGNLEDDVVPVRYPRHRGFSDVFSFAVGLESPDDRRLRLGGRLLVETGAVGTHEITPQQPDTLSVGTSLGAEYRLGDHIVFAAVYGLTFFPPVNADDSAFNPLDRIECVDQDFDLNVCAATRQGRAIPTAAGSYLRVDHAMQLSIRYDTL